jgi:hypothetical protein
MVEVEVEAIVKRFEASSFEVLELRTRNLELFCRNLNLSLNRQET